MTTLSDIEVMRIRNEAIRQGSRELVTRLLKHASNNPKRVFSRVLALDHKLNGPERQEKLLTLAHRLGVSSPRASQAVTEAEDTLHEVISLTHLE
jgi:hypothetical protein